MIDTAVVVTTIHEAGPAMQAFADGCASRGYRFIVIGDEQTPQDFRLQGCEYHDLASQLELPFASARACPARNVARKNIGYLLAMAAGAQCIVETDDDNSPYEGFWQERTPRRELRALAAAGFVNAHRYFADSFVWPRGLPLDVIRSPDQMPPWESLETRRVHCPVHAGLADLDPDVDAIFRLTRELPVRFRRDRRLALLSGTWFPFNSQNTTWFRETRALMYLPSTCTFRVADIWRSFVVQRILWTNDWGVLHHEPTVFQERSPHDLLRDFESEIPGYLHNRAICERLAALSLAPGTERLAENLRVSYEALVADGHLRREELERLDAWLRDVAAVSGDVLGS